MHLQQTKAGSRDTGGPQYFFHDVPEAIKNFLRRQGACPVVLQTPYGIASSSFMAVGRDHKLGPRDKILRGRVGHDRIQQASGTTSIGEAIRHWYGLPLKQDFRRIDVDVQIHPEGHFILAPLRAYLRGGKRAREIERPLFPLSFHHNFQSSLWRRQIDRFRADQPDQKDWLCDQFQRVVREHHATQSRNMHEADLLRAAGALAKLGLQLGPYLVRYYDCDPSLFRFLTYPEYVCPVEVKKHSRDFRYQMLRYKPLPRAVVLCLDHDLVNVPEHIDVIELSCLADFLQRI